MHIVIINSLLVVAQLLGLVPFVGCDADLPTQESQTNQIELHSFEAFERQFGKHYKTPEERSRREIIFEANRLKSFVSWAHYVRGEAPMFLAINRWSDLTRDEFRDLMRARRTGKLELPENCALQLNRQLIKSKSDDDSGIESDDDEGQQGMRWEDVLDEWKRRKSYPNKQSKTNKVFSDHRKSKCLNVPKCQDDCGSCAVFSTTGLYEWAYCKQHSRQIDFSEQYVIDCADQTLGGVHVCEDGIFESQVASFVENNGFELAHLYAYRGLELDCPYGPGVAHKKRGIVRLNRAQIKEIPVYYFERQLKISPIVAAFYLDDDTYPNYGGGVDLNINCNKSDDSHSMLIVGSGRQNGVDYWLLRNSLGSEWGEKGYYKLSKTAECYANEGFGYTLETLVDEDYLEDKRSEARVDGYNFYKNPNYDWKILAKALGLTGPSTRLPD